MKRIIHLSLYWKCQIIGWSIAALYWSFTGWAGGSFNPFIGIIQFFTDVVLYVLITHFYRNFALKNNWQQLMLNGLVKRIIPSIAVMGFLYTVVTILKIYTIKVFFHIGIPQSLLAFSRINGINILIAGIRLMSIWLLAYHLYQYAQREIRLAKENARLELNFKEAQMNNLSAQLNPHFLFNALNTIKSLVVTQPQSARRGIDLLSELLRSGLYQGQSVFTSLGTEMDLVKDYLELEQLRMEERLRFEISCDETLLALSVPRLSIQTLVENAVKHGVSQFKEGGLIRIHIVLLETFLRIRIENPGLLQQSLSHSGIGLTNLRERLQMAYHGKASFEISMQFNGIICSTLTVPI